MRIKGIWANKKRSKNNIVLEIASVDEGNLQFDLSLEQASELSRILEDLLKRINRNKLKQGDKD